jgi:S-DNA-T family DNA segregation ATPase FtsK/SpoIIIE
MERRYEYFAEEFAGIQNLADYNKKVLAPAMEKARKRGKVDEDMPDRLPYIVIIFDEFNDFMLTYPKEITIAITSLTQKGRAAGIHLILATQRPDVKVITGTIKANIPARIALKTSSAIDSRTILDQTGAEDLLGKGDMLFMDPGESRPFRVQAPFVSSEEIKSVIEYIKDSYYNYEGEKIDYSVAKDNISTSGPIGNGDGQAHDDDYLKARDYIVATQRASASGLQSKFGWGFPKANGMIMKLEDNGVVSALEGNKRRVLVNLNGVNEDEKRSENVNVDDLF